jgi:hypothetical protein
MSILAQKVRCYEGEFAEPLSVLTRTISTRFAGGTGRGKDASLSWHRTIFFLVFVFEAP